MNQLEHSQALSQDEDTRFYETPLRCSPKYELAKVETVLPVEYLIGKSSKVKMSSSAN
jgi:hypothetical protein